MSKQCSIPGCRRVVQQFGKCGAHNTKDRRALEAEVRRLKAECDELRRIAREARRCRSICPQCVEMIDRHFATPTPHGGEAEARPACATCGGMRVVKGPDFSASRCPDCGTGGGGR